MATGTIVRWKNKDAYPSIEEVELRLRMYLDSAGSVRWYESTWLASLQGAPSIACNDVEELSQKRFFEVFYCDDEPDGPYIDVMVRLISDDAFTRAVARGFAEYVAKSCGGTIDPP